MNRDIRQRIRAVAQQILAQEAAADDPPKQKSASSLLAIERLRRPLSALTGVGGFYALMKRALVLARAQTPDLIGVHLKSDGSLDDQTGIIDQVPFAGLELTSALLGLLATFVGESLMLRIVLDIWPVLTAPATEISEGSEDDPTR
jgi:hypothetical protein